MVVIAQENHTTPAVVAGRGDVRRRLRRRRRTGKAPRRCWRACSIAARSLAPPTRLPTIWTAAAPRSRCRPAVIRWPSRPPASPTTSRRCWRSSPTCSRSRSFPSADVATRRAELITTIRQEEDDPASVAVNRLVRELYGPHPYARMVRGTVESVEAITRDDLVPVPSAALHARRAHRRRGRQPAGGGDDRGGVRGAGARGRPGVAAPARHVPDADVATGRRLVTVPMPDKAQARRGLRLRRASAAPIPATWPRSVMNNALGQYALGGRLGDSIRERQGMAYYVFSSLDAGLGPGAVMVRAGVSADNVERTIASIDQELALVLGEGFTEKEIAESKQYLVGSLPRQLETNGGIASFLLNAEFFGLGLDYDRRLPDLIRGVTRDAAIDAGAPAARSRPRDGGRRRARGRTVVTDAGRDQGRLLRRRLHADLSRARRFRARATSAPATRTASPSTRCASTTRSRPRRSSWTRSRSRSTTTGCSSTTPRRSSSTWAAAARTW